MTCIISNQEKLIDLFDISQGIKMLCQDGIHKSIYRVTWKVSTPSSATNHHATTIPDNRINEHTNSAVEHKKVPPPEQLQRPSALKSTQSNPYLQHQQQQQQPSSDARETVSAPTLPDAAKSNVLVDVLTESDLNDLPPGWLYAHGNSQRKIH